MTTGKTLFIKSFQKMVKENLPHDTFMTVGAVSVTGLVIQKDCIETNYKSGLF